MDCLKKFEEYLKENYHYDPNEKNNTIESYISDIKIFKNLFIDKFGEDIDIFTRGHFIEYKNYMLNEKNYKYSTINRKIASLSVYEDFLIEYELKENKKVIKKTDFYKIDLGLITSDMLPKNTIKKVILKSSSNLRDYVIFVILNESGMRISELINIQVERDINLDMRKILVLGKGNKAREIFINNMMYDAINEYLPDREQLLNGKKNKYLIVSNKTASTGKTMTRQSINNILKDYCIKVKEDKINPHIMRHNKATTMYEEGASDIMIKKQLGQNSNVTDRYVHTGGEKIK